MNQSLRDLIEKAATWPEEDQKELADFAREIEARRTGTYRLSPDERAAIEEGLDQAREGSYAPLNEIRAFWTRHGA